MPNYRSSEHNAAISDFTNKLREYTTKGVCGRPFVFVERLIQWLKSDGGAGGSQASRLLAAAYPKADPTFLPITTEQLCDRAEGCLLIFSILLQLDWGDLIDEFWRREKVDKNLPIDLNWLRNTFKELRLPKFDADELAFRFDYFQWKYCPARFDLNKGWTFIPKRIIPICRRVEINQKGGTAQLWEIEVPEEFVGKKLREVVKESRYDHEGGNGPVSQTCSFMVYFTRETLNDR